MKQFWKSRTIWGVFIALLPTILQVAGIPLPVSELVNEIIVAAGGSFAVYGRVGAVDRLTLK
jgi:hypothetical protein